MGASLVDAAAASMSSAAELFPKPAAAATPTIQRGPVPLEPSPQNRRVPDGVFGDFVAMNVALSAACLCSGDLTLAMLVDSGATHDVVDPLLTPWLQEVMSDFSVLSVPHTIVTAGQHVLQGVATATVRGTIR